MVFLTTNILSSDLSLNKVVQLQVI